MRAGTHASPADCAACRAAIRQGSRSFHLASRLLPVRVREPAYAVYAFCRMADDRIDRDGGGPEAIDGISHLLDRVYAGRPEASFVERGLADAVAGCAIPRALPDALVEGLAWDAQGRRCGTLSDLVAYAVRVAGAVGMMMAMVMDRRDPAVLARACDLGVAMQLTNICRDVGEDAAAGRLYLPLDLLRAEGIDAEEFLARPASLPGLRRILDRLLAEAEALYDRALCGIGTLPAGSRAGINAARLLYREIGRRIAAGADPVAGRTVVSGRRKLVLLARAPAVPPGAAGRLPALAEAEPLLAALRAAPMPAGRHAVPEWWRLPARAVRMIELLDAFGRPRGAGAAGRAAP